MVMELAPSHASSTTRNHYHTDRRGNAWGAGHSGGSRFPGSAKQPPLPPVQGAGSRGSAPLEIPEKTSDLNVKGPIPGLNRLFVL